MLLSILLCALGFAAEESENSNNTTEGESIAVPVQIEEANAEDTDNEAKASDEESSRLKLVIDHEGLIHHDNNWVVEKQILDLLVTLNADTQIVINAHPEAPSKVITDILGWCRLSGLNNVAIEIAERGTEFDPLFSRSETDSAENLNEFGAKDLKTVKPKHWKFPQNPYGNTDYTAYALEWGETKIGLGSVTVGVLPRIQLGTYPILDVLGIQNLSLKGNLLRDGRLDAAGVMSVWWIPTGSVLNRYDAILDLPEEALNSSDYIKHAFYASIGLRGSLRITEPWSAHIGASYIVAGLAGNFEIDTLPNILLPIADQATGEFGLAPHLDGNMLMVNFATDYRFNRRDSIVLMGRFVPFVKARVGVNIDEWAGVDTGVDDISLDGDIDFSVAYGGVTNPLNSYALALAWQFSWKHVEARVGWGISAVPYTWVIGPFDVSYRFGGKTRRTQTRIKKGWRDNQRDLRKDLVDQGTDVVPAEEAVDGESSSGEAPDSGEETPNEGE